MTNWSRKDFLKASLIAGGAAMLPRSYGAVGSSGSANGDIRVAVCGIGGQGGGHVKTYYKMPGTRLVALCDADSAHLAKHVEESKKQGITVTAYRDYRKLLEDKNIDAVVFATPNHWHSLMTIQACQAGKDVYVEKPLSHNVWEGRKAVEAAAKYKRIVQAGTQTRSSDDVLQAIAYTKAGKLGKIKWVRGLCYKARPSIGKTSGVQPIPSTVDYDLWSGPAPLVPPHRNSPSRGPIHYDWHWFWNYGGGDMANQGIHQMDVARWILGEPGLPPSVMSIGGRFGYEDDAETPNTQICVFGYEKAPLIFEVRGLPAKTGVTYMDAFRGSRVGVVAQYEGGYLTISESGTVLIFDNNNKKLESFTEGGPATHRANFIEAVRNQKLSIIKGKIEECHVSSSLCHLGNISYRLGGERSNKVIQEAIASDKNTTESFASMLDHLKANGVDVASKPSVIGPMLKFEPKKERFAKQEKVLTDRANALLTREFRKPFVVPEKV